MAIVKCKECGAEVSTQAAACPKCGAKRPKSVGLIGIIFVAVIGYVLFSAVRSAVWFNPNESRAAPISSASTAPAELPKWNYYNHPSQMGKGNEFFAELSSTSELNLAFPYSGTQHASIALMHRSDGMTALLSIEKGQFVCGYPNCAVKIRFDDGDAKTFDAFIPTDNSHTALFVHPYAKLAQGMKSAKIMRVQAPIYQAGSPVLEFNVAGFDPQKLHP